MSPEMGFEGYGQSSSGSTYNVSVKLLLKSTVSRYILPTNYNGQLNNSSMTEIRMNVNQITFAILISVLLVADIFLVWSLGYIVLFFERRGSIALRKFNEIQDTQRVGEHQQRSDISVTHHGSQL